jgi:DNA-directed RNA polymerase subunit omega
MALTSPRVDILLENVDSPYASVIVAAKRARQINSYYHNLGEGTFEEFPPPMVESASKNFLTIALEEVAAGKVKYHYRGERSAETEESEGKSPNSEGK